LRPSIRGGLGFGPESVRGPLLDSGVVVEGEVGLNSGRQSVAVFLPLRWSGFTQMTTVSLDRSRLLRAMNVWIETGRSLCTNLEMDCAPNSVKMSMSRIRLIISDNAVL